MKVFQILNDLVHWDATPKFGSLSSTEGRFAPDMVFVEAPDYVFEGWGYDETQEGDARFIKPTPPEGWLYDENTGTFYPEDYQPPVSFNEQIRADVDYIAAMAGVEL